LLAAVFLSTNNGFRFGASNVGLRALDGVEDLEFVLSLVASSFGFFAGGSSAFAVGRLLRRGGMNFFILSV